MLGELAFTAYKITSGFMEDLSRAGSRTGLRSASVGDDMGFPIGLNGIMPEIRDQNFAALNLNYFPSAKWRLLGLPLDPLPRTNSEASSQRRIWVLKPNNQETPYISQSGWKMLRLVEILLWPYTPEGGRLMWSYSICGKVAEHLRRNKLASIQNLQQQNSTDWDDSGSQTAYQRPTESESGIMRLLNKRVYSVRCQLEKKYIDPFLT